MSGKSRIEKILENLLGENNVIEPPIGRDEKILYSILNDLEYTDPPESAFEDFLLAIKTGDVTTAAYYDYNNLSRDLKILFCKLNGREYFEQPISRLEKLLIKWLYLDLYITYDGTIPFSFRTDASYLYNYIIHGTTNGVGDRSLNEIPLPHYRPYFENRGIVYESNSDGTVTANGTVDYPSGSSYNVLVNDISPALLTSKTYTMSAADTVTDGVFIILYFYGTGGQTVTPNNVEYRYDDETNWRTATGSAVQTRAGNAYYRSVTIRFNDVENVVRCQLQIRAYDGTVLESYVYKPMFFEGDSFMPFDIYNKYKLTVKTNDHLTSIPLEGPVYEGDKIEYLDTGIKIPTDNGDNIFDILSDNKPERVELTYDPLNPVLKLGKQKTILKK